MNPPASFYQNKKSLIPHSHGNSLSLQLFIQTLSTLLYIESMHHVHNRDVNKCYYQREDRGRTQCWVCKLHSSTGRKGKKTLLPRVTILVTQTKTEHQWKDAISNLVELQCIATMRHVLTPIPEASGWWDFTEMQISQPGRGAGLTERHRDKIRICLQIYFMPGICLGPL